MRYLRKNTAVRITVGPFLDKTDGITPETALTVTNCHIVMTLEDDDGTAVNSILDTTLTASGGNNDMVHIAHGMYDLELTAANTNYNGRVLLGIFDEANHCPVFHEFMILPAQVYDSLVAGSDLLDVSAAQLAGTALTGRDIGASVLLSSGTGTGQLDFTSGVVKSNLAQILGTALTETAGYLAAGFKQFFNIASPTSTMNTITTVTTTTTATNLTNAPTNGDLTATMKTSVTTAASSSTPVLSATGVANIWAALTSGMTTANSIGKKLADWVVGTIDTYTGNTKQTGDAYARLGAPAGASVSADIATLTAAIVAYVRTEGTVTADGSEQTVYEVSAPTKVYVPDDVHIDLTNMASNDTVVVKVYTKVASGGAYILMDTNTFTNAQSVPAISVKGVPNRYGYKVTIQQTAGVNRNYLWEKFSLE